ncbi:MAG: phosphomannomutase/phosphoglucomutase [Candidatus Woesearchaeota archaeon]|jgi:phosphomannomutase
MAKIRDYQPLFKAYDIRGVFPKELDKTFACELGKAFVLFTGAKEVAVGYDGRTSSKPLFESLAKGIMDQGANVVDLGLCSTPKCYFSVLEGKYDAGIMITASHNPKEFNGFKLMGKKADPIFSENGSFDILEIIKKQQYPKFKKKGKVKKANWSKEYVKFLKTIFPKTREFLEKSKTFKLVVDQSNGSGAEEVQVLKETFPKIKIINQKVSGSFPGHSPDPLKIENRKGLVMEIKKNKASIGIIFDGDADRVCFVDEKGEFIRPDIVLNLLAEDVKRGTIVYDTRSSRAVWELAEKRGLKSIMSKAGRTYLIQTMKQEQAEIGAENSGHFFFKEFSYLDNAGICAIKLLSKLIAQSVPLSEIVSKNNLYFHSGEINFKVKNQSKAFLLAEQAFTDAKKILFIDGLSVYYDNYWFNVRKSNTENIIRINAEATNKKDLDILLKKLNNIIAFAK